MTDSGKPENASPVERFRASMIMDQEKWRDGIGYDLDALRQASPAEHNEIERLVLAHTPRDWRDVEALALIGTQAAHAALRATVSDGDPQTRMAVARHAPELIADKTRRRWCAPSARRSLSTDCPTF